MCKSATKAFTVNMLTQIPDHMTVSMVWDALTKLRPFVNAVNFSHLLWCANTGDLKKITDDKYLITSAYFLQDQLPAEWH
jgi:hypothetical protein